MPKLEFDVKPPLWAVGEMAFDVVTKRLVSLGPQTLQIEATNHGGGRITVEYRYVYIATWLDSGHVGEVLEVHLDDPPKIKVEPKPKKQPAALPSGKQKRKSARKDAEKRELERRRLLEATKAATDA